MKKTRQPKMYFMNDSDFKYFIFLPHNKHHKNERRNGHYVKPGYSERFSLPEYFNPEKHDIWVKVWNEKTIMFSCVDKKLSLFKEQSSWKGYKTRSEAIWDKFWKKMNKEELKKAFDTIKKANDKDLLNMLELTKDEERRRKKQASQ